MARRKKIWKMIRIFLFAAAIAVMHGMASQNACESDTLEYNKNGVRHHGALRVEAARLVNHAGEAVQLRGMSSHGLQWYPEYTNCSALVTTKEYGANLFRAAMYADSNLGGYSQDEENAAHNKMILYHTIRNALAADMYVVADWHLLEDENPLSLIDKAIPFFDELSQFYADELGDLIEIPTDFMKFANHIMIIHVRHFSNSCIVYKAANNNRYRVSRCF